MSIKTTLSKNPKKDEPKASKSAETQKVAKNEQKTPSEQTDNGVAPPVHSAVNHVKQKHQASRDVIGGSLANTGIIIAYGEE